MARSPFLRAPLERPAGMRRIRLCAVWGSAVLSTICWAPNPAKASNTGLIPSYLQQALNRRGLMDTELERTQGGAVLAYENLGFGSDGLAMGTALAALVEAFPTCTRWSVVPKRWGTPVVLVNTMAEGCATKRPEGPPDLVMESTRWARPGTGGQGRRAPSSRGKVDLVLHPLAKAAFGQPGDPLLLQIGLAPELVTTLGRGTALGVQVVVPLRDEFGRVEELGGRGVRLGRVALSWLYRPDVSWLVLADVGVFDDYRYGASLEVERQSPGGLWSVGAQVGCTGYLAYRSDGVWVYSDPTVWSALLGVGVHPGWHETTFRLSAGRFLHRDRGVRLDIGRWFRRVRVGFLGVRTTGGTTAGVDFGIALSRRGWGAPSRLRVRAPAYFPLTYRFRPDRCGYALDGRRRIQDVIGTLHPMHVAERVWELKAGYEGYGED